MTDNSLGWFDTLPKWLKYFIYVSFVVAIVILFGAALLGYHVKVGPVEINGSKEKDTVIQLVKSVDTIYQNKNEAIIDPSKKQPAKIEHRVKQKVDERHNDTAIIMNNSKNINLGTNNGYIGDIYNEKILSKEELRSILIDVKKLQTDSLLNSCIHVIAGVGSSGKIIKQIQSWLTQNGFSVDISGTTTMNGDGYRIYRGILEKKCIDMIILSF